MFPAFGTVRAVALVPTLIATQAGTSGAGAEIAGAPSPIAGKIAVPLHSNSVPNEFSLSVRQATQCSRSLGSQSRRARL